MVPHLGHYGEVNLLPQVNSNFQCLGTYDVLWGLHEL